MKVDEEVMKIAEEAVSTQLFRKQIVNTIIKI